MLVKREVPERRISLALTRYFEHREQDVLNSMSTQMGKTTIGIEAIG